ncbi:T9SS type A sorting domain-containing protein, partial [Candidatus Pacearchaeota archaeon]|nr:T9SS type A sorting domain-containing protein [Candidatus Pacearchaeota archaeon]
ITWNNAPAHWDNTPSNYLFSFEFLPHATDDADTTYTFDVTQYVAADANGIISFFMADTVRVNSTSQFWSKENTNGSPPITLVILETAGLDQDVAKMPQAFSLSQNYPNPFNPKTTIDFSLPQNTNISITIFDILGNQVKTLAKSMIQAGDHSIVWDGTNENNQSVPTGVYFCQMTGNNYKQTIKMLLMK